MSNGKVGIVVVTYNRLNLLQEVIGALRKQDYHNYSIIVVNNGSTDGTEEWLSTQTDLIVLKQANLGGSGGFFTGMKFVAEHDFSYCWIMDDDVVTSPTALTELIKAMRVADNIGFVCSRVIGIDGRPMNTPFPDTRPGINGYSSIYDKVADNAMVKVLNATFVSVLFKTETIREKGLPIKEYFIWGDDIEYTERLSMNYPCYIACRSLVTHKRSRQGSLSFKDEKDPKRLHNYFYMYRNNLCTVKIRGRKKGYVKRVYINIVRAIKFLFKGKFQHCSILIKGTLASLTFNPKIQYPNI